RGLPLVPGLTGLGKLLLQGGDGLQQLGASRLSTGARLGVGALPFLLFGLAYRLLDLAEAPFQPVANVARDRSDLVPALLEVTQSDACLPRVRHRQQRLPRLLQQLLLDLGIAAQLRVPFCESSVAGREEAVLGAFEPAPQRVLSGAVGASRSLPLLHQFAITGRGRAPVGGVGELLRFGDDLLFELARLFALLVQAGKVRLASLGEGVARSRHALPQGLLGGTVRARCSLPLVDELAHALTAGLP